MAAMNRILDTGYHADDPDDDDDGGLDITVLAFYLIKMFSSTRVILPMILLMMIEVWTPPSWHSTSSRCFPEPLGFSGVYLVHIAF
jgi:hypothetical protein